MQWFRFYNDVINDPKVQCLPGEEFRKKFTACLSGEENEFSRFLDGPYTHYPRPCHNIWKKIREKVFKRDHYTCSYCGARGVKLQCDHIMPVSRGGAHTLKNLTTACFKCNQSKGAKLLKEWRP